MTAKIILPKNLEDKIDKLPLLDKMKVYGELGKLGINPYKGEVLSEKEVKELLCNLGK